MCQLRPDSLLIEQAYVLLAINFVVSLFQVLGLLTCLSSNKTIIYDIQLFISDKYYLSNLRFKFFKY